MGNARIESTTYRTLLHVFTLDSMIRMFKVENKVRFGSILTFPSFDGVWVRCKQEKRKHKKSVILIEWYSSQKDLPNLVNKVVLTIH